MRNPAKTELPALISATLRWDTAAVREELEGGANPDAGDADGRTALMHAAIDGKGNIVALLLGRQARVNAQDKSGLSALHCAAQGFHAGVASLLIRAGAELDIQDQHGNTPLSKAVFESKGRGEMIGLLVQHGAQKGLKNKYGVSADELARSIVNYDVHRFLEQ
jgi:ankyrin repeat protein